MRILVVGAGFAGVWAAASAARSRARAGLDDSELQITVVSPCDDLVIRPRLYEPDPDTMRVPLSRILGPVGVRHLAGTVTGIDHVGHRVRVIPVIGDERWLSYDRLVLASGSRLIPPAELPGASLLRNVDTISEAKALEEHLRSLPNSTVSDGRFTAVVIGAGFTGIEVATELVGRLRTVLDLSGQAGEPRVVLVDRNDTVGHELGPGPRPFIREAIGELGIELRLGSTVTRISPTKVELQDGERIATQTVVWTAGMTASELTRELAPARLDPLGRLQVDEFLKVVGIPDVFAAGDTAAAYADEDHRVMQSCQHAIPQGKHVGYNAVADLLQQQLIPFSPGAYSTCLDLGGWGGIYTQGWDRRVTITGAEGKARKQLINRKRIYPPVDDRSEILRQADPRLTSRQATNTVFSHEEAAVAGERK